MEWWPHRHLLFQKGLYDNSPSIELAKIWFKNAPVRNISVGSTNLNTGLFNTFDNSVGQAMVDAVISLGSVPFFFPRTCLKDIHGQTGAAS